jgi:hypothetical protein
MCRRVLGEMNRGEHIPVEQPQRLPSVPRWSRQETPVRRASVQRSARLACNSTANTFRRTLPRHAAAYALSNHLQRGEGA